MYMYVRLITGRPKSYLIVKVEKGCRSSIDYSPHQQEIKLHKSRLLSNEQCTSLFCQNPFKLKCDIYEGINTQNHSGGCNDGNHACPKDSIEWKLNFHR